MRPTGRTTWGVVFGTIVQKDDLQVLVCLAADAVQTAVDGVLHVVGWYDKADKWLIHKDLSRKA